jgi:hypothetical protein
MFSFINIIQNLFYKFFISNNTNRQFLKSDWPSEIDVHINPDFIKNRKIEVNKKAKIGINKNMDIYLWNGDVDYNKISQAMNTDFIACIDYDFPILTLKKLVLVYQIICLIKYRLD